MTKISHRGSCRQNIPLDLNVIVLKKAINRMANAELDNVKPMKSGRVFVEIETKQQHKNLLKTSKPLDNLPVKVPSNRNLNSSKFFIKCEKLEKMEEELQQGTTDVKRISIH